MTPSKHLLVVSHVVHHEWEGKIWAYTPYVAELELWTELFEHVVIASPTHQRQPPADCSAIDARNVRMAALAETGGPGVRAKLRQAVLAPVLCIQLFHLMRAADVVHVRCPGNLGLLGVIIGPLSRRHRIVKYAGQWSGYPAEASTYRLQRWLLRSRWWGGPVTVYGREPRDPPNVISFFSAALTEAQVERGTRAAALRRLGSPLRVIFVGRLSAPRNADVVVRAVTDLVDDGLDVRLRVVGDGSELARLRRIADESGHAAAVTFSGAIPLDQVLEAYEQADVLVLVSESEGYGKAAVEAMAYGLIVIGSESGYLQTLLDEDRGILVPPGDVAAVRAALRDIVDRPHHYDAIGRMAAGWASEFSLEGLQRGLVRIMHDAWGYERPGISSDDA